LIATAQKINADQFFVSEHLKAASYSIYAIDAKTGVPICETAQKSLSTASVMKLMTTAVALELLGPDYTFSTSLYHSGIVDAQTGTLTGDLILKGGGDPAFYSSFFEEHYSKCFANWVSQLKKSGIRRINGSLILDLSSIENATIPGGWCWDDIGNYYGAGVSSLTFSDNLYDIHFASPETPGVKATIKSISPEITGLKLENKVHSSSRSGDHTIVYGAPGSNMQLIEGTIPTDQSDFVVKAAMPDPPLLAGQSLLHELRAEGIGISGIVTKSASEVRGSKSLIGIQLSPPLKDLIVPLNKESLNLFAEHLLLEAGRKSKGEPSVSKGIEAYHLFCKNKGIDTLGYSPVDGSGLTRSNAMTAKTLVETMKYMYGSTNSAYFLKSLPIAGVDGTLRNSFKKTPLEKNLMAKTGSMARVRSIAGTMKTKSKRTILFAILVNNFDLTTGEMTKLLESILLGFYND
jgi:D-alanyl-D-alanine carboxypeptidase/D-alanyl-D-alanine-endopeptidase (penicillin-binding protein 4)